MTPAQVKRNFDSEKQAHTGPVAASLRQAPIHRFSFNEAPGPAPDGTRIKDSIGGLSAMVRGANAEFTGDAVQLPGGSSATEAYLDFPNGLISSHESPSIEFWVTQTAARDWCRILSIGTNLGGEISGPGGNFSGSETLTLFGNVGARRVNRFARSFGNLPNGGPDRDPVDYSESDYGVEFHQVITYDKNLQEWHWYRNGILMEVIPDTAGATTLDDVNVWLGRSEFSPDNNLCGQINEVRIYKHALSEEEILGNFQAGPDKLDLADGGIAFNWQPTSPGRYSYANTDDSDHWSTGPGGAVPNGPGSIATFASELTGDQEIELSTPVTLGTLILGTPGAPGSHILLGGNSAVITMDSGNHTPASITQLPDSPSNHVRAAVSLKSDTEVTNRSSNPLVIDGEILGGGSLVKTGTGPVILTGTGDGFSGQVRIVSGALLVRDTRMLATSEFSISEAGQLVLNHETSFVLRGGFNGAGPVTHQGLGRITLPAGASITSRGNLTINNGSGPLISEGTIDGPHEIAVDGELVLAGASRTRLQQWLAIGRRSGGNVLIRDSASVEIEGSSHLNIGDLGSGLGSLIMHGGSVSFKELFIGKNAGVSGVLLQSGGALKKSGSLDSRVGGGLPGSNHSWGFWRMTGGTYQDEGNLQVGAHGTGVMEIDGGHVTVDGFLGIGRYKDDSGNPSRGVLDVQSGRVTTTAPDHLVLVGEEGIGVLNIRSSGQVVCANRLIIGAGTIDKPGDGTVNLLAGGMLKASGITQFNQTAASGRLNLDGGTLMAGRSTESFLEGLDSAIVRSGGARIDTNGFDIRINQALLAPEGKGLVEIPVLRGGSNYRGAPWIDLGGGATAVANLTGNSVRSITITNPGDSNTKAPAVNIIGEGGGSGLLLGSPVLQPNRGGGLVKTGSGTLTLGGANTYPGVTTVRQGKLRVDGRIAGSVAVSAKATLAGGGTIGGPVEMAPGSTLESSGKLAILGDLALRGILRIDPQMTGGGTIDVAGELDLTESGLSLKSSAMPSGSRALVIAGYGSLRGKFAKVDALPAGYRLDYAYNGLNQIALVATADVSDGD
jgi:autotransporter-associated beta strand protein